MLKTDYRFLFQVPLIRTLLLSSILWIPGTAQEEDFRVQSIEFNQDGELTLEFPSVEGSYYLLKRGTTVDILDSAVAGEIGTEGTGQLIDADLLSTPQIFYAIQQISINEPLDSDDDGIDDVFELQHPDFLSPFNPADAPLDFDQDTVSNLNEYLAGSDPTRPPVLAARIKEISPANGEEMVNVTRNAVVYFDSELNPDTIDTDSLYMQMNQTPVEGRVEVSSTNKFATFFPDDTLTSSTELQVVVDGNRIRDLNGDLLDADGDGVPGGMSQTVFRTLAETRISGTHVWGYVKDSFSGDPIEGVMIYVNAFPTASDTTGPDGRFELVDMPAPEFFVHIVGETAENIPEGFTYPNVGKSFHSVYGQSVQISKDGEPFDIFLPPMALGDSQTLSETETTEVGFGTEGKNSLAALFPEIDPAMWDAVCIEIAPGSVRDDIGNSFNQAAIIPVPPNRIPEPLPPELGMPLVISIQAFGGTRFDVPAPVTFPNLPDPVTGVLLPPGAKSGLWSFNHDAGRWELQGSMTVSEDGMYLVSDPGVGILAPGWHGANAGNEGEDGGGDEDDDCTQEYNKFLSAYAQCLLGAGLNFVELAPAIGCAVSLASSAAGAAVDCNIDPSGCASAVNSAALGGVLGCIPGVGLVSGTYLCLDALADTWVDYDVCRIQSMSSFAINQADNGFQTAEVSIDSLFEDQIELIQKTRDLYEAAAGDPAWWAVPFEEVPVLRELLAEIEEAMMAESPGSVEITGDEASSLLALPRPSNLTDDHVNAFITRFNRFSTPGGITTEEQTALEEAANALGELAGALEAGGWETSYDAFTVGLAALSQANSEQIVDVKHSQLFYKLTDMNSGFTRRGQLNSEGQFSSLILGANTYYLVDYADPDTLAYGTAVFNSPEAGNRVKIPRAYLSASTEPDSDMDGLPDDIEDVVGTDPLNPDTDGDGIRDGAELKQGLNPLDGVSLPVDMLANVPLPGWARGIDTDSERAYVATGEHGLAVIDITDPLLPIVVGQLDLSGNNLDVTLSESAQVAALVSDPDSFFVDPRALHFVDVSDPMMPELRKTLEIAPQTVVEDEGIFYVSTGWPSANQILLFEGLTLEQIGGVKTGGNVTGMILYKDKLFAAAGNNLEVYSMSDPAFPQISSTKFPGRAATGAGWQLHAEDDVLFVGTNTGYETIDISDPANPQTLAEPDGSHAAVLRMSSNGSGLLLATSGNSIATGVDIFTADDPATVDQLLTTIFTGGRPQDVALKDGIALIADDFNGLTVWNYLDLDRTGTPPVVSLDLASLDIDPATEGIQVVEGSRVMIEAKIFDDVQMRESAWLLNGQLMDSSQTGHTMFTAYLPLIADVGNQASIQVRATDTGGNTNSSNAEILELVTDNVDPDGLRFMPAAGGAGYNVSSIELWFNEAIDPASIDLNQIVLTHKVTGQIFDFSTFTFANPRMLVLWLENPLTFDEYQLTINAGAFTDTKGNPLADPLDVPFTSYDVDPTTAVWISDADGSFNDSANWIFGLLPRPDQNVFINHPSEDPVVTFDGGPTAGNLTIHEPFIVDRGNGFFQIRDTWTSTATGTLSSGTLTFLGDALLTGPVNFDGGGIQVSGTAEFQSDFNVTSGSITMNNADSQLEISGTITPGDLSIECRSGAVLEIPWITSMGATNPALNIDANGSGSSITLPNLESLTPPVPNGLFGGSTMVIEARSGGVVNLPLLQTIDPGRIRFNVNGLGSSIQIPGIDGITGPEEGAHARIDVVNSGLLTAGPITALDLTDLRLDDTAQYPVEAVTTLTNGLLEITGFTPDLSNLDTVENISLVAISGGVIELAGITTLNQVGNEFRADRENSLVRLPDLELITGSQSVIAPTTFRGQRGGQVELPAVTTLNGYFQIRSTDENSQVNLPALTQLTSIDNRVSLITAATGGTIEFSNPNLIRGDVFTTDTGTISASSITTETGSLVRGPGTLSSSLTNQSTIRLDKDTGPVTVNGSLILDTDSLVEVTIGLGVDKTGSGKLDITGAATLGGTLEIKQSGAYSPQVGDQFEIITFDSKTLDFQQVDGLALKNDLVGQLEITPQSIILKVVAP